MKRILYTALAGWVLGLCLPGFSYAQAQEYHELALLFSQTEIGGTARVQGLGGAQLSLGGDISSITGNPAGLGMYNRNDASISLANSSRNSSTTFFGAGAEGTTGNFHVPNFGLVFNKSKDEFTSGKFRGGSFGISFNRIGNFNQNLIYGREGNPLSIIDNWLEAANGIAVEDLGFYTNLAYEAFLIEPDGDPGSTSYFSYADDGAVNQTGSIELGGSHSKIGLAYGGNFDDVLFFGASLGIQTFRYSSARIYTERFPPEGQGNINSLRQLEFLDVNGTGINFSFGLIYRLLQEVQIGVNYTTPTWYGVFDEYDARMRSNWNNFDYPGVRVLRDEEFLNDLLITNYALTSPSRIGVGASIFLGKNGFISLDAERVNFNQMNLRSKDFDVDLSGQNNTISETYRAAYNLRGGAEVRLSSFRLRGGYSLSTDPVLPSAVNDGVNRSVQSFTAGAGYRAKNFYIDLAYINTSRQGIFFAFPTGVDSRADIDFNPSTFMLTVGFPF